MLKRLVRGWEWSKKRMKSDFINVAAVNVVTPQAVASRSECFCCQLSSELLCLWPNETVE